MAQLTHGPGRLQDDRRTARGRRAATARRLVARRQLPLRRADLPARQPAAPRAADRRAHQASPARALRHDARPQPGLRAPQPRDPRARSQLDLHHRAGARRARRRRMRVPRRDVQRDLLAHRPRRGRTAQALPPVLVPRRHPEPRRTGDAGSIHEGGELGYALSHAFGAAFDNPDLLVACVVGDGEAETGPLATSWHSNKFLNAKTDGAVLPILHLNGYKIANPTVLARIPEARAPRAVRGLRLPAADRLRRRTGRRAPAARDGARRRARRHRAHPARRARGRRDEPAAVADADPAHAEGLDRTEGGRRPARGEHVALASGSARRRSRAPEANRASSRTGCEATVPTSSSTSTARSFPSLSTSRHAASAA